MFNQPPRLSSIFRKTMFRALTSARLPYSNTVDATAIHTLFKKFWPVSSNLPLARVGEYVIADPNALGAIDALFSPGVGENSQLELHFAKTGIPCWLADGSASKPAAEHPNIQFLKKYIGPESIGEFVSLNDWVGKHYRHGTNAILQMDIEWSEYESILATPANTLSQFKMIVIEVHKLNMLTSAEGFALGQVFFRHLLDQFDVLHFHINNYIEPIRYRGLLFPSDIELTLVRKNIHRSGDPVASLPHKLDRRSTNRKPDPRLFPIFSDGVIAPS